MATDMFSELEKAATQVTERLGPATVAIGRAPRGSGFVVAANRVVTNAHNLRDRTTQVTFEGRAEQASVLAADTASDLVVLEVDTGDIQPIEWADRIPGVGGVVFAVARGMRGIRLSTGFVSGTERTFRGPGGRQIRGSLEHTAPMARGSSGGPLVDVSGKVVGVNTHRLGEGFYLAQSAEPSLVDRIRSLAEGRSPRRAELGIAVAPGEVARRLRRSVGLDERDGVLVRAVAEDSPAARADLREGDLIVSAGAAGAGGADIASIDDLHRVLGSHDVVQALELRVVRGVDEVTLTVTFDAAEATDSDTEEGADEGA